MSGSTHEHLWVLRMYVVLALGFQTMVVKNIGARWRALVSGFADVCVIDLPLRRR